MAFLGKMFAKKPVSTNQNFKLINDIYTPEARQGTIGTNYLSALLTGQGDVAGANAGLDSYYQRAGFQPALDELSRGITGGAAAAGLLRSGSTSKALLREGGKLNNQFYTNYLNSLGGLAGLGQNAGQLMVGAGGGSTDSMRPGTAGTIGKIAGTALSLFGSDRRLKENIVQVGAYPNGLPMYEFNYKGVKQRLRGVMAEDVEKTFPEAVFTMPDGYAAVDYGKLGIEMEKV